LALFRHFRHQNRDDKEKGHFSFPFEGGHPHHRLKEGLETMKQVKHGKAQILLGIYERLLSERKISKEEILSHEKISPITFKRYLYDIKDYLLLNDSAYVLVYARHYKVYKLIRKPVEGENHPSEETAGVGSPKLAYR
jgi:hypothetical protein